MPKVVILLSGGLDSTTTLAIAKSQIIKQGLSLGVDYSQTISCYQANKLR